MIIDRKHPLAILGIKRNVKFPPHVADYVQELEQQVRYWGEECAEFEPECICCKAWAEFYRTGKSPKEI